MSSYYAATAPLLGAVTYEALVDETLEMDRTPGFYVFVRIFTELTKEGE